MSLLLEVKVPGLVSPVRLRGTGYELARQHPPGLPGHVKSGFTPTKVSRYEIFCSGQVVCSQSIIACQSMQRLSRDSPTCKPPA
jgi:hypothetical protein